MPVYLIRTEAGYFSLDAADFDAAARQFAAGQGIEGVLDAGDLEVWLAVSGDGGYMEDVATGLRVFTVPP